MAARERVRVVAVLLVVLAAGVLLGSAIAQWRAVQPPALASRARAQAPPGERIRVEVLNSGGRKNVAREATDLLRDRGFDVVYFGNADRFDRDSSAVIDRVGRHEPARLAADALGIGTVLSQPDTNLYVDVSVLLGRDWTPAPADTAAATSRPWWDPRALWQALRRRQAGTEEQPGRRSVTDVP
ncbi:MAG: LytR C-terminal domain-containing protein [Gemmatimonadetes bacterium]|nr:LytR C-terminal domain-containing protein [Gemmatimonadota bacterium]